MAAPSSARVNQFKKIPIPPDLADRDIKISDNARTVLARRYLRRGADGQPVETEQEMFWRVAYHVALAEKTLGDDIALVEHWARKFFDLLTNLNFFPNSPTFTGAGTPLGQLAACFVLGIEDDMGRTGSGIFDTLRQAALIQQTGGGNGFSFSRLRPSGAIVRSSGGAATGPVGFLRVYDQAFGEIAQGGCLIPDTLIFTEKGLLRLDEIVTHTETGWRSHSLSVNTDDGPRQSTQAYNNGVSPVLRVTTDMGLNLAGTPNHKVKIMTTDGPVWRRLDELQSGDAILVKLGQHQGRLQALRRPTQRHGSQVMPQLSPILDEELAFFLGYMAGDGFVATGENDHRIGVSVAHNSYLMREMPSLMGRLFGDHITVHRQQKANDASVTFVIDNRAVKDYLVMNGLAKSHSTAARVPRLIRQSPPNIVGAYLRGLFEVDGAISHHHPQLLSTSEALIREAAILLMGLGCPVRISQQPANENRYGTVPVWSLRITSHIGLRVWQERIRCSPGSRFKICMEFEPDLERETSYELPHAAYWIQPALDATALPQIDRRSHGAGVKIRATSPHMRRQLLRYLRGDRRLTASDYARLAEKYADFAEYARPFDDLWFVMVESVEDAGEALTLDIEVEGNHTYLANGMVTHNSRRGANMAVLRVDHPDIRKFITCKTDENAITNFNISVGITDEFMQAVEKGDTFDLRFGGQVYETVDARELFNLIVKQAHHNGEPGVLFLDTANAENPVPHLYELESTNPCVTGDTLVATPDGWRRVDEIEIGDEISTVLGTGKVHTVEVNEAVPVFKVRFSDGGVLRATAAHQFHTRNSGTKFFEPRRLDELKEGDWIRVFKSYIPNNPVPQSNVELEDRDYGFLVGILLGDGCYTPRGLSKNIVRFSSHVDEEEWNAIVRAAFEKIGSTAVRTYTVNGSRALTMDPKPGRVVADWIKSIPLPLARSPEKSLPEVFINSNYDFLVGLLDGIFSTDGSVDLSSNHPLLRFHTSSKVLAQQVRRILLMFGIHGRIFETVQKRHDIDGRVIRHDRPKYDVVMSGQSFGMFFDQIRLSHPDKQYRMEEAALKSNFTGGDWAARVVSIEPDGVETVYDLYEPRSDTWITEGYVSRGCGEQFLGPHENCCLGSINLAQHVTDDDRVDWDKLANSIATATRFLDDVVTENKYVPAVPELREAAERVRRIGLGIMGLADMMYRLSVRYGAADGQEFASQIIEFVRYHAMRASIALAQERGPFPAIEGSRYDPKDLQWTPPTPLVEHKTDWGRPTLDWGVIERDIRANGIRNGAQTTIAPTGTIATVSGCEGYGCEPVFALAYLRYVNTNAGNDDERMTLQYTSPLFERALRHAGLDDANIQQIVEQVNNAGSCQDIDEIPAEIRRVFVTASDITAEEHVRMQAAMQAHVDNALSKTINYPSHATEDEVAEAYQLGWQLGCKGMTVYVTGSRDKVVLETKETRQKREGTDSQTQQQPAEQQMLFNEKKKPRPRKLAGRTYRLETPAGTTYITINENGYGEGQPFEVFIQTAKAGSEIAAVSEAMGRLISLVLRMTSTVSPRDRVKEMIRQLESIGGGRQLGFGPNRVSSLPDAIAQVLQEYLNDTSEEDEAPVLTRQAMQQMSLDLDDHVEAGGHTTHANGKSPQIGDLCPECGDATLIREEGCLHCYTCGYSEC